MRDRIVLVGAGSALFTRGLLGNLVVNPEYEECTIVLMDVDPEILSLMEHYARRLVGDNGYGLKIEATTDLAQAVDGADFVVCTVAANDSAARLIEIEVPLSCGYHHSWGDTTGPSGVFRALRHIPIFLELAGEMERRCPGAWLLNLTNPMTALCRAVSRESKIKILGFCDGPPYFRRLIEKKVFGLPEGALKTKMVGVDHLVWVLEMYNGRQDLYPQFRTCAEKMGTRFAANRVILDSFGYYPIPSPEHLSEFFSFVLRDRDTMEKYGLKDMDVRWHRQRRKKLLNDLDKEVKSSEPVRPVPLPPEEEITDIIRSIVNDEKREYVASLPNDKVISNLPDYAIVEAPVLLGAAVEQLPTVTIPPQLTGPLHDSIIKDELVVEAVLTGSRELVFQAVLSCPLITSIKQARDITSAMLEALKDYLPVRFV
ncbi:MAG: hypothetical protein JXQ83_09510 [Candidatus Glassbacteria bacterium]|nr:hypothetical protein [Candidatus Glassbacteria bacterium]